MIENLKFYKVHLFGYKYQIINKLTAKSVEVKFVNKVVKKNFDYLFKPNNFQKTIKMCFIFMLEN